MHFLVLAAVSLTGVVAAVILAVRAAAALRTKKRPLRAAALLAGSGAILLYVFGLLNLAGAVAQVEDGGTDSFPPGPCREAGGQIASQVVGYDVGYVWLRFDCRLSNGGTLATSAVPGYVNPGAALLAVTAVVLAAAPRGRLTAQEPSNGGAG